MYESFILLKVEAEHSSNDILVKYLYFIKPSFICDHFWIQTLFWLKHKQNNENKTVFHFCSKFACILKLFAFFWLNYSIPGCVSLDTLCLVSNDKGWHQPVYILYIFVSKLMLYKFQWNELSGVWFNNFCLLLQFVSDEVELHWGNAIKKWKQMTIVVLVMLLSSWNFWCAWLTDNDYYVWFIHTTCRGVPELSGYI